MKQWIIDHESLPLNISEEVKMYGRYIAKGYRRMISSYRKYPIRSICSNAKLMMMFRDIFDD